VAVLLRGFVYLALCTLVLWWASVSLAVGLGGGFGGVWVLVACMSLPVLGGLCW